MDPRLSQAAESGSIDALYALIRKDPYVLEKIDDVPFIDTPLHVAAASGRAAFAMEMMNLKPSFARKLNADGLSPLHLAVGNNQTELIGELLEADPHLVRVKGREGMTPLHLVVRRGDVDLVAEFLETCPECVKDVNVDGKTALHIAVANDRFEVLQVLTGWSQKMYQKNVYKVERWFLNKQDRDGNTALHIAACQNQPEAVKHLVKCQKVNPNILNGDGLTVLDILKTQRQSTNGDLEETVRIFGGSQATSLPKVKKTSDFLKSRLTFCEFYNIVMTRVRHYHTDENRGVFLIICSLVMAATYQTALQPPGGVHQGGDDGGRAKAGTVVMEQIYFILIWVSNTVGFCFATFVTYVLLPIGGDYAFWFICISASLCISYAASMAVISPNSLVFLFATLALFLGFVFCLAMIYLLLIRLFKLMAVPRPALYWFWTD